MKAGSKASILGVKKAFILPNRSLILTDAIKEIYPNIGIA